MDQLSDGIDSLFGARFGQFILKTLFETVVVTVGSGKTDNGEHLIAPQKWDHSPTNERYLFQLTKLVNSVNVLHKLIVASSVRGLFVGTLIAANVQGTQILVRTNCLILLLD